MNFYDIANKLTIEAGEASHGMVEAINRQQYQEVFNINAKLETYKRAIELLSTATTASALRLIIERYNEQVQAKDECSSSTGKLEQAIIDMPNSPVRPSMREHTKDMFDKVNNGHLFKAGPVILEEFIGSPKEQIVSKHQRIDLYTVDCYFEADNGEFRAFGVVAADGVAQAWGLIGMYLSKTYQVVNFPVEGITLAGANRYIGAPRVINLYHSLITDTK